MIKKKKVAKYCFFYIQQKVKEEKKSCKSAKKSKNGSNSIQRHKHGTSRNLTLGSHIISYSHLIELYYWTTRFIIFPESCKCYHVILNRVSPLKKYQKLQIKNNNEEMLQAILYEGLTNLLQIPVASPLTLLLRL